MRILYISANPEWGERLQLERELKGVNDAVFWDVSQGNVQFEVVTEVQRGDVLRYTALRKPTILQFSGHSETNTLQFSDDDHEIDEVDEDWFRRALTGLGIRLVVLNSCYSATLADSLEGVVDVVIGCNAPVRNDAAKLFSPALYRGLLLGLSVQKAFEFALNKAGAVGNVAGGRDVYEIHGSEEAKAQVLFRLEERSSLATPQLRSGPPAVDAAEDVEIATPALAETQTPAQIFQSYQYRFEAFRANHAESLVWEFSKIVVAFFASGLLFLALVYYAKNFLHTTVNVEVERSCPVICSLVLAVLPDDHLLQDKMGINSIRANRAADVAGGGADVAGGDSATPVSPLSEPTQQSVMGIFDHERWALFAFFAAGSIGRLMSLLWLTLRQKETANALQIASILPEEDQARELASGRIERSLQRLEGGDV